MKITLAALGAIAFGAGSSFAGGIERAPQSLAPLFEAGNYVELSFGGVDPTVRGRDVAGFQTGDVAQGYGFMGLAYKHQFTDALSGAFIIEQPFGADILYPIMPEGSLLLEGTRVRVDSTSYTALLRYKFDNHVSVHGGLRGSHADGRVTLSGFAYQESGLNGYNLDLAGAWGMGWTAGVAYEIPELAARISLTYNSPIEHDFKMTESIKGEEDGQTLDIVLPAGTYPVRTPRSWVLESQAGIAKDTLLFGSVRWVNWSEFKVDNFVFPAVDGSGAEIPLVDVEDSTIYTIGIGRQFTDLWAGSASFLYEPRQSGSVSPLAPTNGRKAITLAAVYSMDNIKLTTGINYTKLGSTELGIGPSNDKTTVAKMDDSDAWGVGMKIGYSF